MSSNLKLPEFTFLDWLAVHDITVFDFHRLLGHIIPGIPVTSTLLAPLSDAPCGMSLREAWALVGECFAEHFPAQRKLVTEVCENVVPTLVLQDDVSIASVPYTRDVGFNQYPVVALNFSGSLSDLLCVAHEFAHALQIVASRGAFNPPVMREVCAFMGELLLLRHLKVRQSKIALLVETTHSIETEHYIRRDLHHLKRALTAPYSGYDYRWNYPVSRILAAKALNELSSADHWTFFRSGTTFPEVSEILCGGAIISLGQDVFTPSMRKYAALGYKVLRFIDRRSEGCDVSIGDFREQARAEFHADTLSVSHYCLQIGYIFSLLAKSTYHRTHDLRRYFRLDVLPALSHNQFKLYLNDEGDPDAVVTWAWLDVEVEREVHSTGRALKKYEWNSGHRPFFNDWVSPHGNIRKILEDMVQNVLPGARATSLRRNADASVKRICRWISAKGDLQ